MKWPKNEKQHVEIFGVFKELFIHKQVRRSPRKGKAGDSDSDSDSGACGIEPHGRCESIGTTAEARGQPDGRHAELTHRLTLAHRGVCQGVPVCQDWGWWEAGRCGHRATIAIDAHSDSASIPVR